jgi:hypothetical protein
LAAISAAVCKVGRISRLKGREGDAGGGGGVPLWAELKEQRPQKREHYA